eukprot:106652_1
MMPKKTKLWVWLQIMLPILCIVPLLPVIYKNFHFNELSLLILSTDTIQSINNSSNLEKLVTIPLLRKNTSSIIYIKTFKTSSSTITNLLHAYTIKHNKSCIIIGKRNPLFVFDFNNYSHKKFVQWLLKNKYTWNRNNVLDIWLSHVTYHPYLFELIPSSNNQIVTIVREPNQRLMSALYFYKNIGFYGLQFAGYNYNMSRYLNDTQNINKLKIHEAGLNSMCKSLMPGYSTKNDTYNVWQQIISGNFLLLIKERYEESLLLLKYAYNMSWSDLIFTSMKVKN